MLNERAVPFLDPSVDLSMTGLREWKIRKEMDLFISNWLLFILQGRSIHQEIAMVENSCQSSGTKLSGHVACTHLILSRAHVLA